MKKENKIRFKDLSGWIKILVVFGWLIFGYFIIAIMVGFVLGIIEMFI